MAIFNGTIQEFHHFLGPRVRNAVNALTRKCRIEKKGICEHCGEKRELHSAHIHGRDRRTIIEKTLEATLNNGLIRCDLEDIEKKIIDAHLPIKNVFKFLCHSCHRIYDCQTVKTIEYAKTDKTLNDFNKINRIRLWANKPHQNNHRIIRAFIRLEQHGAVRLEELKNLCETEFGVNNFARNYASMKTNAGNSHGNVFYDEDGRVLVWPRVHEEIKKYFEGTG